MSCNCRRQSGRQLICCHPENPFAPRKRICCDCGGRCCSRFDETSRDCFWPDFTHPTWLCCRILYGCDPLRCPNQCPDPHEDEHTHHEGCHCGHWWSNSVIFPLTLCAATYIFRGRRLFLFDKKNKQTYNVFCVAASIYVIDGRPFKERAFNANSSQNANSKRCFIRFI